jgi:hypothetical protein
MYMNIKQQWNDTDRGKLHMEHRWNDTDRRKQKPYERNVSHC